MNSHSTAGSPTRARWFPVPKCSSKSTTRRHAPISSPTSRSCAEYSQRADTMSERLKRLAGIHHILERHIVLAKFRRPPRRPAARQFDAGVFDLGAGERNAPHFAPHLEAPANAKFAVGGQQPGRNADRIAEHCGPKVG